MQFAGLRITGNCVDCPFEVVALSQGLRLIPGVYRPPLELFN